MISWLKKYFSKEWQQVRIHWQNFAFFAFSKKWFKTEKVEIVSLYDWNNGSENLFTIYIHTRVDTGQYGRLIEITQML